MQWEKQTECREQKGLSVIGLTEEEMKDGMMKENLAGNTEREKAFLLEGLTVSNALLEAIRESNTGVK